MSRKVTRATPDTPAARGTTLSEDDEPGDAEVSLEQIAAVLNNIQTQLGGYGARLAAIAQPSTKAGAEANAETDAEAGVGQGGVPPAQRPAHPDPQGGFYRHCGRTCYVQDKEVDVDDTRSEAGCSDTSSRHKLEQPPARHVLLTDPERSPKFLWTDRTLESLYRNLDEAARQELVDVLVARQLGVEVAAEAHATIRNTSGTARFYALLQLLTTMLDIITDAWHVAPLRLRLTNLTDMLASRLLLDEENDTTDMLCTNKMRALVLDSLQKNAEHTTRKLSGRGNDKDDEDGKGRPTTRGKRGGAGGTRTRAPASRANPPRHCRSPSPERERGRERSRARQSSTAGNNGGARRGAGGDNNGARRGAAAHGGGHRASSQ
jgi:hypothetical protein